MRALKLTAPAAALALAILLVTGCSKVPAQTEFETKEVAARALLQALKTNNVETLKAIFGRDAVDYVASGDPTADRNDREVVALAMEQSWRWAPIGTDRFELIIGDEQWPFPAQLVKQGSRWRFDSEAAKNEVLARRIGRNELDMISLCRAYVYIQKEYAGRPRNGKRAGLFAQHLRSSPGRQDGLYWPKKPGEKPSPMGDLAAEAAAEGYDTNKTSPSAFWGYRFRILTAQGDAAPGGKKSYLVNGDMSGGFAFVAFPAKYRSSGVMTFIVNQDGIVYEKDLGPETPSLAASMKEYNPDESWSEVRGE